MNTFTPEQEARIREIVREERKAASTIDVFPSSTFEARMSAAAFSDRAGPEAIARFEAHMRGQALGRLNAAMDAASEVIERVNREGRSPVMRLKWRVRRLVRRFRKLGRRET